MRIMKPQKRKRSSKKRDRLSEMPDEVIVHILSYLPTFDAVRTMVIRPFGKLWTLVPTLHFRDEQVLDKFIPVGKRTYHDVGRFYTFVRNVLMLHNGPFIDKFTLVLACSYDSNRRVADDLRMFLRFALDKQAKEIYFSDTVYDYPDYSVSSNFPNLTSQSLVTLELGYCCINSQLQVNLGSLKKLILYQVNMCEEGFGQFICGCPSLQELRIVEPENIKYLSFSAPNIRKLSLVLVQEYAGYEYDPLVLDFPNLESLDLELGWIPDVINVSSVRDACLKGHFFDMYYPDDMNEVKLFRTFLEKFSSCEVFQLSSNANEPFLHPIGVLPFLRIGWKRLVLELRVFCQSWLLGIYGLIRSSEHLEELIIYNLSFRRGIDAHDDLPPIELPDPCVMAKLKIVTLHGYSKPWKHQLQLVEFLLKNAPVLEELVIVPNQGELTAVEKLDFLTHVSSFQRSSRSARVLFL